MPEPSSYSPALPARHMLGVMGPEKDCSPQRQEFEVAYYTKELGRPLQRKLLQQRLSDLGCASTCVAAAHQGDQPSGQDSAPPPREDRAG